MYRCNNIPQEIVASSTPRFPVEILGFEKFYKLNGISEDMDGTEYLGHLKFLRDECSNEIPVVILHSNTDTGRHKVRNNWFQGVIADTECVILDGYASAKSMELFEKFMVYYDDSGIIDRLTTNEDIERADSLLTSLIDDFD